MMARRPRLVWALVLAAGLGIVCPAYRVLALPPLRVALPEDAFDSQNGEPDTPIGPGQLQADGEVRYDIIVSLAVASLSRYGLLLANLGVIAVTLTNPAGQRASNA
jgi:hypothetical protein